MAEPLKKGNPVVVRSDVPQKSNYSNYREEVRHDFYYSCAYCSMMETEAQAIGFNIDHYLPQVHFAELANSYENLLWSCSTCNGLKSDYYPKKSKSPEVFYVIRPDHEDPREHLMPDGANEHMLQAATDTGEFNIQKLDLNRRSLRRLRDLRAALWDNQKYIAHAASTLLEAGTDNISTKLRARVQKASRDIVGISNQLAEQIEADLVRGFAKSDLVDPDPEKKERMKTRRKYLKTQCALGPDEKMPRAKPSGRRKKPKLGCSKSKPKSRNKR
ncbi:hypothetical protein KAI87_12895 [Myxococcota bacterium]|nr:hypothetical protein [Myxococcota bacterium]